MLRHGLEVCGKSAFPLRRHFLAVCTVDSSHEVRLPGGHDSERSFIVAMQTKPELFLKLNEKQSKYLSGSEELT